MCTDVLPRLAANLKFVFPGVAPTSESTAEPTPAPPAPVYIQDASPKNLSAYIGGNRTVFLTLFSPSLPKWRNFSILLTDLASSFATIDPNVLFLKGNCMVFPVQGTAC